MVEYKNKKGKVYWLHKKVVMLRSKRGQTIYYFSTVHPSPTDPEAIPDGFTIGENTRSQMPFLKRLR